MFSPCCWASYCSLPVRFLLTVGILADLINSNRKLIEQVLRKQKEGESASGEG